MRATILRLPNGTFTLEMPEEELEQVKQKVEKGGELDDREMTIAREFNLFGEGERG